MKRTTDHQKGQALVEFALASTLIFLLLAAAVDLGLIFFSVQGLHNAAQEGANYGSRWLIRDASTGNRALDVDEIRTRVRYESGDRGGIGFVNLLDLNNNNILDDTGSDVTDDILDNYIEVEALADTDSDGNPLFDDSGNPERAVCDNPATSPVPCYVVVTVHMDYKPVFPLSPALGETVALRSSYNMLIRSTAAEGGTGSGTFTSTDGERP